MFRKFIHIIISLLLLISITGFAVSKHYCGSELVSVKINQETSPCCDMEENCCQNETDFYLLDSDFLISTSQLLEDRTELEFLFPVIYIFLDLETPISRDLVDNITESPPPKKLQDRLSILQSFLC